MKQQRSKLVKGIYIGILITLSILVLESCMNTVQTSSKNEDVAASPPSTPLICPNDFGNNGRGPFVSKQGTQLIFEGKPLKLYGSTFYPASAGGSSAWHSSKFTQYIDHSLALEAQGGQNLIRPTDFWDRHYHDRKQDDITVWKNMEDETPQTPWWQQIYSLPNNDLLAFKTYSQNDLNLISSISAFAKELGKPYVDEEFGMPQNMGDGMYTGEVYNNIRTSRAQFFEDVYSLGEENGVDGFVFWDLGCELGDKSYQVGPKTPAVWHVIQKHAPYQPTPPGPGVQLC